ncbi:unnamed protein product [Amoebophrya sp. A120]|nr:unnamed protein product [Amoebophrya sp. A120]|eukprot:GSA120T00006650001.1
MSLSPNPRVVIPASTSSLPPPPDEQEEEEVVLPQKDEKHDPGLSLVAIRQGSAYHRHGVFATAAIPARGVVFAERPAIVVEIWDGPSSSAAENTEQEVDRGEDEVKLQRRRRSELQILDEKWNSLPAKTQEQLDCLFGNDTDSGISTNMVAPRPAEASSGSSSDLRTDLRQKRRADIFTTNSARLTNSMDMNSNCHRAGLFAFYSRTNHSCVPNCAYRIRYDRINEADRGEMGSRSDVATTEDQESHTQLEMIALRDINPGDEIVHHYAANLSSDFHFLSRKQRREMLFAENGFWCDCPACGAASEITAASDGVRARLGETESRVRELLFDLLSQPQAATASACDHDAPDNNIIDASSRKRRRTDSCDEACSSMVEQNDISKSISCSTLPGSSLIIDRTNIEGDVKSSLLRELRETVHSLREKYRILGLDVLCSLKLLDLELMALALEFVVLEVAKASSSQISETTIDDRARVREECLVEDQEESAEAALRKKLKQLICAGEDAGASEEFLAEYRHLLSVIEDDENYRCRIQLKRRKYSRSPWEKWLMAHFQGESYACD